MKKIIFVLTLTTVFASFLMSSFAVDVPRPSVESITSAIKSVVPASTEPARMGPTLQSQQPSPPPKASPGVSKPEEAGKAKPMTEAERIRFKLQKVILEDFTVFSEKDLLPIYQNKLNKIISVAELQQIAQDITNYYRNRGYILSRAILPPQKIAEGIVHIRMLEGFVSKIRLTGNPKGARQILLDYGDHIIASHPLKLEVLEYYLRIANEVPGVQVRAVLEPSKTATAASDISLVTDMKTLSGYVSYDDYGTRYVGPLQMTANMQGNSIFRSGDNTSFTYVTTTRPLELKYMDLSHLTPVGTEGMTVTFDANQALTQPQFVLAPLNIKGNAVTYSATLKYPMIRSKEQNLTLLGLFSWLDSSVETLGLPLYTDHIRALRFGASYDFPDRFRGVNFLNGMLSQGLDLLGASDDPTSVHTSRFGGLGRFTKVTAQGYRLQQIYGSFSVTGTLTGQYSFNSLLTAEQFGFGGSQLGRGYDPSEIIGDRGLGGSIEFRLDTNQGLNFLQSTQFYTFYDAGVVWNIKNLPGSPKRQDATSAGIGARVMFSPRVSGNVMFTQPISKKVAALEFIGRGAAPRIFFSITANV